jgi:hypothetical protein
MVVVAVLWALYFGPVCMSVALYRCPTSPCVLSLFSIPTMPPRRITRSDHRDQPN